MEMVLACLSLDDLDCPVYQSIRGWMPAPVRELDHAEGSPIAWTCKGGSVKQYHALKNDRFDDRDVILSSIRRLNEYHTQGPRLRFSLQENGCYVVSGCRMSRRPMCHVGELDECKQSTTSLSAQWQYCMPDIARLQLNISLFSQGRKS